MGCSIFRRYVLTPPKPTSTIDGDKEWKGIYIKIYLFIFREKGREREGGKHQCVAALARPLLGTWPAIQACTLTGNPTSGLLLHSLVLSPLSHTNQVEGYILGSFFKSK